MQDWMNWKLFDKSIIVYNARYGKVYGGSDSGRDVKLVEKDSDEFYRGGDFTLKLDLSTRNFVMWINNEKIVLDKNIGDFQYSPIIILEADSPEITLLS